MNTVKPVPPPQSIALSSDRARRHAEVERLRRGVGFEVDDPQTCLYVQANGTRLPRPHGLVELSTPIAATPPTSGGRSPPRRRRASFPSTCSRCSATCTSTRSPRPAPRAPCPTWSGPPFRTMPRRACTVPVLKSTSLHRSAHVFPTRSRMNSSVVSEKVSAASAVRPHRGGSSEFHSSLRRVLGRARRHPRIGVIHNNLGERMKQGTRRS